ncbi:hypothetical protein AVEN_63405-1 [Araneus ventricosus]|uniref:Uncharacterized protein n=1 Tax=Araneus ventricosus TaxID=182803 RepID=A0A4Y2PTI1_ARAVE|nr:hypothetical protein AVEN_63405-1 [Araneus ventricosus]
MRIVELKKNSKSKTSSADSNLGPRCEESGTSKDLPALEPHFECRNETQNLRVGEGSVDGRGSLERGVPAQVSSSTSDRSSKLRGPSLKSPRVASKRDVNLT